MDVKIRKCENVKMPTAKPAPQGGCGMHGVLDGG
jgi:hypothetical protein